MSTIAIIEDNVSNMKLIVSILEKAGYETLTAMNATKGIELIKKHLPDLILMDIHMPGLDGVEATKILKADSITKNIGVIAVTAKAMGGDREAILASGCDDYVSKPIHYKKLLEMIDQLINQHSSIRD
jgi:two-component system cell cycle response regulator DivK